MTLQQLHYAITISETGSLNKAAEILYVAQPSLTGSMQELEKDSALLYFIGADAEFRLQTTVLNSLPTQDRFIISTRYWWINTADRANEKRSSASPASTIHLQSRALSRW